MAEKSPKDGGRGFDTRTINARIDNLKVLNGKTQYDLNQDDFSALIRGRSPIHIDVGTGSGRFVLSSAKKNPVGFFIGIDPVAVSMSEYSVKGEKYVRKQRNRNFLYVVSSVESLPLELSELANSVTVYLPWGSLRDGIVKAEPIVLQNLRYLGKRGASLGVIVGYSEQGEEAEITRRGLPPLSVDYFKLLSESYKESGIEIICASSIENSELRLLESDWARRLVHGASREMFKLNCLYI